MKMRVLVVLAVLLVLEDSHIVKNDIYGCYQPCYTPSKASSPSPSTGATCVNLNAAGLIVLSWTAGAGATSHDVYFGTVSPGTFRGNQAGTTYEPLEALNPGTTYYWRIDEKNGCGTTIGTVWSFRTIMSPPGQATNPNPVNVATDVSITQDLSWSASSGATSYDVYFGTSQDGMTLQGNTIETTFDPGSLRDLKTYYWRIDVKNNCSTTTGAVWSFTTEYRWDCIPTPPTNLQAQAISTSEIQLSWSDNSNNEIRFDIYVSVDGGAWTLCHTNSPNETQYLHTGLNSSSSYGYKVKAYNDFCDGHSQTNEVYESPLPIAPTNLEATSGEDSAQLTWVDSESDISNYKLYRSTLRRGPYNLLISVPATLHQYNDNGLTKGVAYYYVVTATDTSNNESAYSNEAQALPRDDDPPQTPTGLTVVAVGDRTATLNWNDNSEDDLAGYNVYRQLVGTQPYNIVAGGLRQSEYTDNGLVNGQTYLYKVAAVDTSGNVSEQSAATEPIEPRDSVPPASPQDLVVTANDGFLTLDWRDNTESDLRGYRVYRAEASGGPYSPIGPEIGLSAYVDNTVENGTTYWYVVRAVDTSSNESPNSQEVSETPQDMTPPQAPTGLTATAGERQNQLMWTASGGAETYNIYRSTVSGTSYAEIITGLTPLNYTDTSVEPGVTYYYIVKALDAVSNLSGPSNEAFSTPVDTIGPSAPTGLIVESVTSVVSLQWNDNTETDLAGYNVYRGTTSDFNPGLNNLITAKISVSNYTDRTASFGIPYYYKVTAVDTSSNESQPSPYSGPATLTSRVYNVTRDKRYYTIQEAIDDAQWGDRIEAAGGITYSENIVFNNKKITLVGAGAGTTIIDGSGGTGPVVTFGPLAADSEIVGFTIRNGKASYGGGIYCYYASPKISNCVISSNSASEGGGGIMSYGCSLTVTKCMFNGNESAEGGGIFNVYTSTNLSNCIFINNKALTGNGGGIYESIYTTVTMNNCTLSNNSAAGSGGALYVNSIMSNISAQVYANNCIFWGNDASGASEVWCSTGAYACMVTMAYCDIDGGVAGSKVYGNVVNGGGNIGGGVNDDPLFADPASDEYWLNSNSPCINSGDPKYITPNGQTDLGGKRRIIAARVDIGAYEAGDVIYVDGSITTSGDGSNWGNGLAYKYLQDALAAANAGDEIWVAAGTYYPDLSTAHPEWNDDRNSTFQLKERVAIYGGFTGSVDETLLDQRNWSQNKAILSGDIDGVGGGDNGFPESRNCFHVVKGVDHAVIDGFIITHGYAGDSTYGGGGMLNEGVEDLVVANCVIQINLAGDLKHGGGIHNRDNSDVILMNCVINGNRANGDGGAIYNNTGRLEIINCTITANLAANTGGVHSVNSDVLLIDNCIIWGNKEDGGAEGEDAQFYATGGSTPEVRYSCVTDWSGGGTGNIGSNPLFVSSGHWDASIAPESKTVEAKVRDFIVSDEEKAVYPAFNKHPDFEFNPPSPPGFNVERGIVGPLGSTLDANGKPDYTKGTSSNQRSTNGLEYFNRWYRDIENWNMAMPMLLELKHISGNIYEFRDEWFFPIDEYLFGTFHLSELPNGDGHYHNFHFTLELHTTFTYHANQEYLRIYKSDDDLFVYIDGKLVVDIGGIHPPKARYLEIRDDDSQGGDAYFYTDITKTTLIGSVNLNLQSDETYPFDLFYAERHTDQSHFEFSTTFDLNPNFISGDYHLQPTSPCIDAGDNDAVPVNTEQDMDAAKRFFDDLDTEPDNGHGTKPIVDMGAYEYQVQVAPVANNDQYSTYEGRELEIDAPGVLANDNDENGDNIQAIRIVNEPLHGECALEPDGWFLYIPDEGFEGVDNFTYTISDGTDISNEAIVTITVHPLIDVIAGDKELLWPNNTVNMNDAFVDGGNPDADVTVLWTVESVPATGSVTFNPSPDIPQPQVVVNLNPDVFQHSNEVEFILKLWAADGVVDDEEYVVITVKAGPDEGQQNGPQVNPGGPYTIPVGQPLQINATVTDDGLPYRYLGYGWSEYSVPIGPPTGEVIWRSEGDKEIEDPVVTFTQPSESGEPYILKLTATDGVEENYGFAFITVTQSGNSRPIVRLGPDITLTPDPPNPLIHRFVPEEVSDDGRLISPLEYTWTAWGDQVGVTFEDPHAENPMATFTAPGLYTVRLEVYDGQYRVSDEMTVIVEETELPPGEVFEIGARGPQEITLPDYAELEGFIEQPSGLNPGLVVARWYKVEGPGPIVFEPDSSLETYANFSVPGNYVLELEGIYGTLRDTVRLTITVKPGRKIAGGEIHSLFIDDSKEKSAWACGYNGEGECGLGYVTPANEHRHILIPSRVLGFGGEGYLSNIEAVAAGLVHSLAIDSDKHVWAWGNNYLGELGQGNFGEVFPYSTTPLQVPQIEQIVFIASGRSGQHSLAVENNGKVWAWGRNHRAELGIGDTINTAFPTEVLSGEQGLGANLTNIVAVSGGAWHSMALEKLDPIIENCRGRVYTWGQNFYGILGDPDAYDSPSYCWNVIDGVSVGCVCAPVCVHAGEQNPSDPDIPLANIVAISAGWWHSMALEKLDTQNGFSGRVYACGCNGALGNGTSDINYKPVLVVGPDTDEDGEHDEAEGDLENIVEISAGEGHSMARDIEGHVWTWGSNWYGQLGVGPYKFADPHFPSLFPVKVVAPDRDIDGLPDDLNGDGDYTNDFLGDDIPIIAISAGYYHCLAMDEVGNIYSWGMNEAPDMENEGVVYRFGQLGLGDASSQRTPRMLQPLGARVQNLDQNQWYSTINAAITAAGDGDRLVAYPGVYREAVVFGNNKKVSLASIDPKDPNIVSKTIINREGYLDGAAGVTFKSNAICTLSGFTVVNAYDGINCENDSSPTLSNNVIHNNKQFGIYCDHTINAVIKNNLIFENGVSEQMGYFGMYYYYPEGVTVVCNNTVVANIGSGIGFSSPQNNPIIRDCIFWGNSDGEPSSLHNEIGINVSYCCIENYNGTDQTITSGDPRFVNSYKFIDAGYYYPPESGNPPKMYTAHSARYTAGDKIEINKDGVLRTFTSIDHDYLIFDQTQAPDFTIATSVVVRNWGQNPPASLTPGWHISSDSSCYNTGFGDITVNNGSTEYIEVADGLIYNVDDLIEIGNDGVLRHFAGYFGGAPYNRVQFIPALLEPSVSGMNVVKWLGVSRSSDTTTDNALNPTTLVAGKHHLYHIKDTIRIGPFGPCRVVTNVDPASGIITFMPAVSPNVAAGTIITIWSIAGEADIDGQPRVMKGRFDIGVDEFDPYNVEAGDNKVTAITEPLEMFDADIKFAGLSAPGANVSLVWSVIEGPDGWTDPFDDSSALRPNLTFNKVGHYVLALEAFEGSSSVGRDTVVVEVRYGVDITSFPEMTALPNAQVTLTATITGEGPAYNLQWAGPDYPPVIFNSPELLQTTALFDEPGIYPVGVRLFDQQTGELVGEKYIWVPVGHQQVDIEITAQPAEITLPNNRINLTATINGFTPALIEWRVREQDEDLVHFSSITNRETWAEFEQEGEYDIGLVVYDGYLRPAGAGVVTVTVNPVGGGNALGLNAGRDQQITLPQNFAFLSGSMANIPDYSTEWVFTGNSQLLTITPATSLNAQVVFHDVTTDGVPEAATYTIYLVAKDGSGYIVTFDDVNITVNLPQVLIDAGPDQRKPWNQSGAVTFDLHGEILNGSCYAVRWIDQSSSSTIFNPANQFETSATIDERGEHHIWLVAEDRNGHVLTVDEVIITVDYYEVLIDAGPDQDITNFPIRSSASLQGEILEGSPQSTEWVLPSSGIAEFGNPASLDSWIEFSSPGIYIIGLAAKNNGADIIGWDSTTISVASSPTPGNVAINLVVTDPLGADEVTLAGGAASVTLQATVSGAHQSHKWLYYAPESGDIEKADNSLTNPYSSTFTFHKPGTYVIAFQAYDALDCQGNVVGFNKITITVKPEPLNPTLNVVAGVYEGGLYYSEYNVDIPVSGQATIVLQAEIISSGTCDNFEWIDPTGQVTFGVINGQSGPISSIPYTVSSEATFSKTGKYPLAFILKNGSNIVAIRTVTIYATIDDISGETEITAINAVPKKVKLSAEGRAEVSLSATITGPYNNAKWIAPIGYESNVTFSQAEFGPGVPNNLTATFDAVGVFPLTLVAKSLTGQPLCMRTLIVSVFEYDDSGIYVQAIATPDEITYGVEDSVNLSCVLKGDLEYVDKIQWVPLSSEESVHILNPHMPVTTVSFDRPGEYPIALLAIYGEETILKWDIVTVIVNQPPVSVDAKALQGSVLMDEYAGVFGNPSVVHLEGTASPSGVLYDYEWRVESPTGLEPTVVVIDVINPTPPLTANVTISQPGRYVIGLVAKSSGVVVSRDTLNISVISNQPIVGAGRGYPILVPQQVLHLNKAYVYNNPPANNEDITWSCNPPVTPYPFDYTDSRKNPKVSFPADGLYTLTISYEGLSDETDIIVDSAETLIYAGSEERTVQFRPIELSNSIVSPMSEGMTFEWTTDASPDVTVEFEPSPYVLHPQVIFDTPGTYQVTLTVRRNGAYLGRHSFPIIVEPYPIVDDENPEVEFIGSIANGCYDDATIVFQASDKNLYKMWVSAECAGCESMILEPTGVTVLEGTIDNPKNLSATYLFDMHTLPESGLITLVGHAKDKRGNTSSAQVTFTSNCLIHNYKYTIDGSDEIMVLTNLTQTLAFSANLTDSSDWILKVQMANGTDVGSQVTDHGTAVSASKTATEWGFTSNTNGRYRARLTAGTETAYVYFDVILNASELVMPIAIITEPVNGEDYSVDEESGYILQSNPLPTIDKGLFEVKGSANHSTFPNEVMYKLELYKSTIKNLEFYYDSENILHYDYANWERHSDLRIKNVTPSCSEDGWYRGAVDNAPFGTVDFSDVPNGIYQLLLTVKCHGKISYDSVEFVLDCPLKVGNVRFSQEDLVIPLGGYSLRVVRTYDSTNRKILGDFGYGWSFDLASIDIELDEVRDNGVEGITTRSGGEFDRDVTLTMPDGRRVTFVAYMDGWFSPFETENVWTLRYLTPEGINATLNTAENDRVVCNLGTGYFWETERYTEMELVGAPLWQHDVSGFILETEDGTKYHIERVQYPLQSVEGIFEEIYKFQACGKPYLSSIEMTNGDKVEFIKTGSDENPKISDISYSTYTPSGYVVAKSIDIRRDENGRIKEIYPPSELVSPGKLKAGAVAALKYNYDSYGNLDKVSKLIYKDDPATQEVGDPKYEETTYVYDDDFYDPVDNYVTDIRDARGLSPIRYFYDEDGRLAGVYDARGKFIEIEHDVTGRAEVVTDRNNNITVYNYNERGNVTTIEDSTGSVTEYKYESPDTGDIFYAFDDLRPIDDIHNPDLPKMVITDSGGLNEAVTSYVYDSDGRTVISADPLLNITTNIYDSIGNVEQTSQWRPPTSSAQSFPSGYTEVSRTINEYYYREGGTLNTTKSGSATNLLHKTQSIDPGTGLALEQTEYEYDSRSRLIVTRKVDPESILEPYVTTYTYERDNGMGSVDPPAYLYSSSPHPTNPYKVTEPSGISRYSEYNENGNQLVSYYKWIDPANTSIVRYVYHFTDYDDAGRIVQTRRVIDDDDADPFADVLSEVALSWTEYTSIGKVDYTINENSNLTKYEYDELGNVVETRTYNVDGIAWSDEPAINAYINAWNSGSGKWQNALTISQTLYDNEGRAIVSVGPYDNETYDPTDPMTWPVGTETVYDALGRVVETRRWSNVQINLIDLVVDGQVVGKTVNSNAVRNAWSDTDTGTPPADFGWTSGGKLPAAYIADYGTTYIPPLSYTRTIYDSAGRVEHSVALDESGYEQVTSYKYDNAGKQTAVIDPQGHNITSIYRNDKRYLYDGSSAYAANWIDFDNFTTSNFTGTHKTVTAYEGMRRKSVTDARGYESGAVPENFKTIFQYDTLGRITRTDHPAVDLDGPVGSGGAIATYSHVGYDGLGHKKLQSETTEQTDPDLLNPADGLRQFEYDSAGRLTKVILPTVTEGTPKYRYIYDNYGNQVGILDPKSRLTVFKYDEQNKQSHKYMPFEFTDPTGGDITVADVYDSLPTGQPVATAEYDSFGRIEKSTDFKGQVTLFEYATAGCGCGNVGSLKAKKYYLGEPLPTLDSEISYTYDNLGRKITETIKETSPAYERCYAHIYDNEGKITTIEIYPTYADYEAQTNLIDSVGYGHYQVTGRKALVLTPDDGSDIDTQVGFAYDALGRLSNVAVDLRNGYNMTDNDPPGELPETSIYTYNPVGSRESLTYANDNHTQYIYDALNRLTNLTNYQDHTKAVALSSFAYTHYADGMRHTLTENVGESRIINYTYDNLNRVTREDADQGSYGYDAVYVYDLVGNRLTRTVTVSNLTETKTITTSYAYSTTRPDLLDSEEDIVTSARLILPDDKVYAHLSGGKVYYTIGGTIKKISSLRAFMLGLPTGLGSYMLRITLAAMPIVFLVPMVVFAVARLRKATVERPRLSLFYRCLSVLLAYMMLISPSVLEDLTQADIQYSQLTTGTWGEHGKVVTYTYDANGSLETKTTTIDGIPTEDVVYVYNLQNRLAKVTTTPFIDGSPQTAIVTEYKYDPAGNRVSKTVDGITTDYLIDAYNHTGYSQVFVETIGANNTSYIIGDDVLAQATGNTSTAPEYLLYDGHGSTRQLTDNTGTLISNESYSYDAYGVMLGGERATQTDLLYTGEQYDSSAEMYYLRARYYDPLNGRFNQVDPFAGSPQDPQSLHKYIYTHDNPVNAIDPSGEFEISLVLTIAIFAIILALPTFANRYNVCGPDVTEQLKDLTENVKRMFTDLPNDTMRTNYCSSRRAHDGWDIHEFKPMNRWGGYDVRDRWPIGCATGICEDTVMVNGGCYSSHEVNYYLYGVMTKLCKGYENTNWALDLGVAWSNIYRLQKKNNPRCKQDWMYAGYYGLLFLATDCDNLCSRGNCKKCPGSFQSLEAHWKDPWNTPHAIWSDYYRRRVY